MAEARDQGVPYRSARVTVHVTVTDVNDNAPEIVDPQEDVVSVREEQPAGTEVVRIRAIDRDNGHNATITYSILKGRDSDGYGYGMFSIDPVTGLIRTRVSLDHEDNTIYRLAVAATDGGKPPKQTTRLLRIEVLDLNDQRPTFTSSSLVFRVSWEAYEAEFQKIYLSCILLFVDFKSFFCCYCLHHGLTRLSCANCSNCNIVVRMKFKYKISLIANEAKSPFT